MRVLVLNPHMNNGYSGPTVLMKRLFGTLSDLPGWAVALVTPVLPTDIPTRVERTVIRGPSLSRVVGQMSWSLRVCMLLFRDRSRFDLVHVHGAYLFNLLPCLLLRLLKRPYVILPLAVDGDLVAESRSGRIPIVGRVRRSIVSNALLGFALAEGNVDEFRHWGLPDQRVRRVMNPVDASFFEVPLEPYINRHVLVFIGSLGTRKRPDLVLGALKTLREQGWDNAEAIFVGPYEDEAYAEYFEECVNRLGLSQYVAVTGLVSDVAGIQSLRGGVFVLPSRQEGLPGALVEAMAMGLCGIVTDVGAMGEMARESCSGTIVVPDPDEIARAAAVLWSDKDGFAHRRIRARAFVQEKFTATGVADSYAQAIREMVEHVRNT